MKAVIAAGGKGTRIAMLHADVPKPMIPIEGRPVLEYAVACLRANGITDILMTIGYMGDCIKAHFGDGAAFGAHISYFQEEQPLGTAGALIAMRESLPEEFFLINGDILFDVSLRQLLARHRETAALATIATHPNSHPYDSAVIRTDEAGRVLEWLGREDPRTIFKNRVNAGIHVLSRNLLQGRPPGKADLDRDILQPLVAQGALYAYDTPEYIHDMGTPERFEAVSRDVRNGLPRRKNLQTQQKAIFLDRDGVINRHKGFLTSWKEMELLPGVAEAIAAINHSGYLAIVVTNQPVIARGECSWEELGRIHDAMETLLGAKGAYVDDIFVCPHHPDKGFLGEVPELKTVCECRKPRPGLLKQAAEKYNITLSESFMVGDHERDMLAGYAAGCKTVYIASEVSDSVHYDLVFPDLLGFTKATLAQDK